MSGNSPVYNFNFPVGPGQVYYLDPAVATGYLYRTGSGDPLFASVEMPSLGAGISYTLCLPSAGGFACDVPLAPDQIHDFAGLGVSEFEVLVDGESFGADAGLPFATAVSFEGGGDFTGSITPLVTGVPEPASNGVFGLGLGGLLLARRRCLRGSADGPAGSRQSSWIRPPARLLQTVKIVAHGPRNVRMARGTEF